eukprot:212281_1
MGACACNQRPPVTLEDRDLYAEMKINPDEIETTMMLSQRTNKEVYSVVHQTDWSILLDIHKPSGWIFDPNAKNYIEQDKDAWTISLLSPEECQQLIKLTELYGYEHCGYSEEYRSNTRFITADKKLADKLYSRIKKCCPQTHEVHGKKWKVCGLNERFRWCKYIPGTKFGQHFDAQFQRDDGECSYYTVNIYLNDGKVDFSGGRTRFYNRDENNDYVLSSGVIASQGDALMFQQYPARLRHDGEILKSGLKYLMRTDIMYKCTDKNYKHY